MVLKIFVTGTECDLKQSVAMCGGVSKMPGNVKFEFIYVQHLYETNPFTLKCLLI